MFCVKKFNIYNICKNQKFQQFSSNRSTYIGFHTHPRLSYIQRKYQHIRSFQSNKTSNTPSTDESKTFSRTIEPTHLGPRAKTDRVPFHTTALYIGGCLQRNTSASEAFAVSRHVLVSRQGCDLSIRYEPNGLHSRRRLRNTSDSAFIYLYERSDQNNRIVDDLLTL